MEPPPKPIDIAKKLRWKNYYDFAGVLPNLSMFSKVQIKQIVQKSDLKPLRKDDTKRDKSKDLTRVQVSIRAWILISEYLSPKDLMFKI